MRSFRGRRAAGALAALLVLAGPAAAGRDLTELERQKVRDAVERYRARMHWSEASLDVDAVVDEVEERVRAGSGSPDMGSLITELVKREWASWIPRDPAPQHEWQYRYPLDVLVARLVLKGAEAGAIGFLAREGTPVYAAREGTVMRVVDGFTRCCRPEEEGWQTNRVFVVHGDGSVAQYGRLRPRVLVEEGQPVAEGEILGYAGITGATEMPGLDFRLWMVGRHRDIETLPVRFRDGSAGGARPSAGESVRLRPAANVKLRLLLDAEGLRARETVPVTPGQRLRLRVRLVGKSRKKVDVTQDARTRFDTPTPWLVDVGDFGVVRFRRESWEGGLPAGNVATVTAIYADREEGAFGVAEARFELAEPRSAR